MKAENKNKINAEDKNASLDSGIEKKLNSLIQQQLQKGSSFMLITHESEGVSRCLVFNEEGAGPQFKLIRTMAKTGDLDSFFRQILSEANTHGHDSAFLKAMGVSYEPIE